MSKSWVGTSAAYNGYNRPWLNGKVLKITDENNTSVKFSGPNRKGVITEQWCSKGSMFPVEAEPEVSVDMIANAAGTELERIQAEIKRLRNRLSELEEAEAFLSAGGNVDMVRRISAVLSSI